MCGRYTITVTEEELMLHYMIDEPTNKFHTPRYAVLPQTTVPIVTLDKEGKLNLVPAKWSLVPFFSKTEKYPYATLNARAETVDKLPTYRTPFRKQRCLIPADGIVEWTTENKEKLPWRIAMKDEHLFSMAGIFDIWKKPDGSNLISCSIITMEPTTFFGAVHDRMPFILSKEDEKEWLKPNENVPYLKGLLRPFEEDGMRAYRISKDNNYTKNQGSELIEELK